MYKKGCESLIVHTRWTWTRSNTQVSTLTWSPCLKSSVKYIQNNEKHKSWYFLTAPYVTVSMVVHCNISDVRVAFFCSRWWWSRHAGRPGCGLWEKTSSHWHSLNGNSYSCNSLKISRPSSTTKVFVDETVRTSTCLRIYRVHPQCHGLFWKTDIATNELILNNVT